MYKDKEKQKEANREASKRYRQGMTEKGEGMTAYPDILNKLTDSFWRERLGKVCRAFKESHYPKYANEVLLGVPPAGSYRLSKVCELLEVTK